MEGRGKWRGRIKVRIKKVVHLFLLGGGGGVGGLK